MGNPVVNLLEGFVRYREDVSLSTKSVTHLPGTGSKPLIRLALLDHMKLLALSDAAGFQ